MCVCVCVCVCACVRACVRACVCVKGVFVKQLANSKLIRNWILTSVNRTVTPERSNCHEKTHKKRLIYSLNPFLKSVHKTSSYTNIKCIHTQTSNIFSKNLSLQSA